MADEIEKTVVEYQSCSLEALQAIRLKVAEVSPDAMVVVNKRGIIVDLNEECEFLFGYARSDLITQPIEMLIPEEIKEGHKKHVEGFFRSPRRREMGVGLILEGLNREGERFKVNLKLAPIVVNRAGLFCLAVIRRVEK